MCFFGVIAESKFAYYRRSRDTNSLSSRRCVNRSIDEKNDFEYSMNPPWESLTVTITDAAEEVKESHRYKANDRSVRAAESQIGNGRVRIEEIP